MIDLHTHSFFSDGELVPSELIRRAMVKGYRYLAITDHVDFSNYKFVIESIGEGIDKIASQLSEITVFPGVEITHVPPAVIPELIEKCRETGAKIVVVHGETIVEPVASETNRYAITGKVDILAHPGLITWEDVLLAKENGVRLEITTRGGHSYTNGHVSKLAVKAGAKLIIDTDSHSPYDLVTREDAGKIALGAGLTKESIDNIFIDTEKWIKEVVVKR